MQEWSAKEALPLPDFRLAIGPTPPPVPPQLPAFVPPSTTVAAGASSAASSSSGSGSAGGSGSKFGPQGGLNGPNDGTGPAAVNLEELGFLQPGGLKVAFEGCDTKPGPGGVTTYILYAIQVTRGGGAVHSATGAGADAAAVSVGADAAERGGVGTGSAASGVRTTLGSFGERWFVHRRFSDFEWLHERLQLVYHGCILPPLAPKGLVFRQKEGSENKKRMRDLEAYLNRALRHPRFCASFELQAMAYASREALEEIKIMCPAAGQGLTTAQLGREFEGQLTSQLGGNIGSSLGRELGSNLIVSGAAGACAAPMYGVLMGAVVGTAMGTAGSMAARAVHEQKKRGEDGDEIDGPDGQTLSTRFIARPINWVQHKWSNWSSNVAVKLGRTGAAPLKALTDSPYNGPLEPPSAPGVSYMAVASYREEEVFPSIVKAMDAAEKLYNVWEQRELESRHAVADLRRVTSALQVVHSAQATGHAHLWARSEPPGIMGHALLRRSAANTAGGRVGADVANPFASVGAPGGAVSSAVDGAGGGAETWRDAVRHRPAEVSSVDSVDVVGEWGEEVGATDFGTDTRTNRSDDAGVHLQVPPMMQALPTPSREVGFRNCIRAIYFELAIVVPTFHLPAQL